MVDTLIKILSVVIMAIIVFSVDYLFLRNKFWQRLAVNMGIVIVYLVFFVIFLNN